MSERTTIEAPLARWSGRIALFSASLLIVGVVLHRLTPFPTPVALNLFRVAIVGCAIGALVGLVALAQIWRRGYAGAGSAALGVVLPLVVLAWPLTFVPVFLNLPPINDVTTDAANAPRFGSLAPLRKGDGSPAAYPAERLAPLQKAAYPDLRTFVVERSAQETFELVEEAARRLKWKVASSAPPTLRPARAGLLEATDHTLIVGFADDVVVRVEGSVNRSRVDVRSSSRYGVHDLGQTANRVRRFLTELQARVDATTSLGIAGRRGLRTTRSGAMVKKGKGRDQRKEEPQSGRVRVRSSAQGEPIPKELRR
jgi:uncharacterized protein (DUF1499 family)